MTIQFSVQLRNGELNSIETTIGEFPALCLFSGMLPANCAADIGDSDVQLVVIDLPSNWLTNASSGIVQKQGTWAAIADETADAGYFRIFADNGICHIQGPVSGFGGTGDLQLTVNGVAGTNISAGDTVTVQLFALTAGNA